MLHIRIGGDVSVGHVDSSVDRTDPSARRVEIQAHTRRRRFRVSALLIVGGLLATSCGGDDATGEAAGTEAVGTAEASELTEAPAGSASTEETEATEGTGGTEAADQTEATGSAGGDAAAVVEQYLQLPTSIELDTPVGAEIPTGLSLYFVSCGAEACEADVDIIQEAADILGWEFTALSTDGSPQQIQNAWEQVVREAPDGVIYTATPRSQIDQYITDAAANGTAIAACCVTDEPTDGLLWTMSTPEQIGDLARPMAAWVVNDGAESGNEAPGALYVDLPDFPILTSFKTAFEDKMTNLCPDCPLETLEIGLADLENADANIVSTLRANSDLKYVVTSADSVFTSLPAALSAAGLNEVKIFGSGPSTANLANIASGAQAGSMAFGYYEIMFGAVDAIAREKAGVEVIPGYTPPNWIVTADNLPSSMEYFKLVPDVFEHFTELWGKS